MDPIDEITEEITNMQEKARQLIATQTQAEDQYVAACDEIAAVAARPFVDETRSPLEEKLKEIVDKPLAVRLTVLRGLCVTKALPDATSEIVKGDCTSPYRNNQWVPPVRVLVPKRNVGREASRTWRVLEAVGLAEECRERYFYDTSPLYHLYGRPLLLFDGKEVEVYVEGNDRTCLAALQKKVNQKKTGEELQSLDWRLRELERARGLQTILRNSGIDVETRTRLPNENPSLYETLCGHFGNRDGERPVIVRLAGDTACTLSEQCVIKNGYAEENWLVAVHHAGKTMKSHYRVWQFNRGDLQFTSLHLRPVGDKVVVRLAGKDFCLTRTYDFRQGE